MLVRDAMNKDIQTIKPDDFVTEAARRMRDGDFGAMPVCDGEEVVGMITDRDIAIRVVAEAKDPQTFTIREAMTPTLLSCRETEDLRVVSQRMADHQVRRLPVIDENNKLVGVVSLADVAIMNQDQAAEAIGGISERRHDEPPGQSAQH